MVHGFAPHLLRRHVTDRPQHYPRRRQWSVQCRHVAGPMSRPRILLSQPEVEDFHATVLGDEQVLRLQVAMHHALLVRGGKSLRNLQSVLDRPSKRRRTMAEL